MSESFKPARKFAGLSLAQFPRFLLPLIFVNMTGHMALSGGRVTGSLFVLDRGAPASLVGIFMALFWVVPVLTSLSIGRWVDRAGASRVIRMGMGLVLFGAWLPVVFPSMPALLMMAVMVGSGFNVVTVAAQHTVGHLEPGATAPQRLANFGWFAIGHSASSTLGPFIAGLVIDSLGFRAAFAAMAMAACIAVVLVFTRLRGLPRAHLDPQAEAMPSEAPETLEVTYKPHVRDLLGNPELRRIYIVNMVASSSWDLFMVMLPVLGHQLGFSASVIGTVFSLFAVGTLAARAFTPWLGRRYREWQIMRAALIVVAVVYALFPLAVLAPALMALGLCFGCAVGLSQPNILSMLHSAAPPGRGGEAVGLRAVLSNSVSVTVPLLFGAAVVPVGVAGLLWIGAVVFGLGVLPAQRGVREGRPA